MGHGHDAYPGKRKVYVCVCVCVVSQCGTIHAQRQQCEVLASKWEETSKKGHWCVCVCGGRDRVAQPDGWSIKIYG